MLKYIQNVAAIALVCSLADAAAVLERDELRHRLPNGGIKRMILRLEMLHHDACAEDQKKKKKKKPRKLPQLRVRRISKRKGLKDSQKTVQTPCRRRIVKPVRGSTTGACGFSSSS